MRWRKKITLSLSIGEQIGRIATTLEQRVERAPQSGGLKVKVNH